MSIYALPTTKLFCPTEFSIQVVGNVHVNTSPLSGATQTVEFPGDRRVFSLQYGPRPNSEMAPLRAFWNRFRGQAHMLRIWNLAQPEPLGTLSGTVTLSVAAVQGANSVTLFSVGGGTLLQGDWIGIPLEHGVTQTVEVMEDAGPSSPVLGHISPPLRRAANQGVTVTLIRPPIDCLLTSPPVIHHGPGAIAGLGYADGFSVDAVEFIY
jgi:hypothetical protein